MAELAEVKAAVKAWEKAFKRDNGRAPTKHDLEAGGITEQYKRWRKLEKAAKAGLNTKGKEKEKETNGKRKAEEYRPAHNDHTTTPTPRRRVAGSLPSPPRAPLFSAGPASTPTTKRPRLDDAHNPFSASKPIVYRGEPARYNSTPKKPPSASSSSPRKPYDSPLTSTPKRDRFDSFVHVSSPRDLRALLDASTARRSAKKVEDTPRTHARRFLTGEIDTPVKARQKRGMGALEEDQLEGVEEDNDTEEGLGPTPAKNGEFRLFGSPEGVGDIDSTKGNLLSRFQQAGGTEDKSRGRDLFPLFRQASGSTDKKVKNGKRKAAAPTLPRKKTRPAAVMVDESDEGEEGGEGGELPVAEAIQDLVASTPQRAESKSAAKATPQRAVLQLSDDEWDPEASPRTLTIVGTRRAAVRVVRGYGSDDDDLADGLGDTEEEAEHANGVEGPVDDDDEEAQADGPDPGLLSLLSLRSPIARTTSARTVDLRVRALLDPTCTAAVALRAQRRGQDVFACGEIGDEDEYGELGEVTISEYGYGDDDWESDPEGWKAVPGEDEW